VEDLEELARRGGRLDARQYGVRHTGRRKAYGRKLHAELGRLATRVKISEMRRC
jgi:hypothetical protein